MSLQVLYEDNHLIAINKEAGRLSQGDKTGDAPMAEDVKAYLKTKYGKPGDVFLGVIHRLDRPVSGVIVFARTSKALERMNKLFHDRAMQKTYWAITKKAPNKPSATLVDHMLKDPKVNKSRCVSEHTKGAMQAELSYELLKSKSGFHLLAVRPKTGRPHQIRVQLAKIGCVISGDLKYGATEAADRARIHLHARSLAFIHPVKKEPIEIVAPLPPDPIWARFMDS